MALREMGSVYAPAFANIAYVMRDGSGVDVVPVDIDRSYELFTESLHMTGLVKAFKASSKMNA